jgi:glycosyltransferase involved in cell wall biosynthesis
VKAQNLPAAVPESRLVLHYTGANDDRGGAMSVIRGLAEAGRFGCVLGVNPGFTQGRVPPLRTLELPSITGETINLRTLWRARAVARAAGAWLREDAARVFHAHSRAGLVVALWLARSGERRVVASVHCYGRRRWFYRWAARQLGERMVWLTPAMKAYYGVGLPNWDGCIPNSLPESSRTSCKLPRRPGRLVIGGAGLLVRWKGWHHLLEALALLPADLQARIEFRHIGAANETKESAAYARELRRLAEQRGVASQISWLGWQPSSAGLLAEADCLLVASDHEPFSMAALEALFAGVPVIAADSGGPKDFITAGRNGWFFTTGDARDLARILTMLATSDALAQVRIDAADLQRFTASIVVARWEQIYAAL